MATKQDTAADHALDCMAVASNAVTRGIADQHAQGHWVSKHAIHSQVFNRYICRQQEEFQVPEMFCCKCLLPLWPLFDDVQVHDGSCGTSCKHNLGDFGKMLLAMARDRSLPKLALLIPQGSHENVWKWMFASRIPGILQLFGGLMETS